VFEVGLELIGPAAQPQADAWWSKYWYARAATIYAGTSEIQRNIVSERILGLPREPR
jgi:alkylation response protein AidB-like acyl-CoA dehydrogenase